MKRRRYPRGISISALRRMSANDRLQLWHIETNDVLEVPPRDWIDSEGTFPTRDEAAAALTRALEALRRKVYAS